MANVAEVVFFYSKFSKACGPCVQYIINNKLPVVMIALDTEESRNRVINGQHIQIKNVPSMIVSYTNNDVQLYVGNQKIIAWFEFMISPNKPAPNPQASINHQNNNHNNQNDNHQNNNDVKSSKKKKTKKRKTVKHIKSEFDPNNHTELIFEDQPESDVYNTHNTNVHNTHNTHNTNMPSQLSSKISTSAPKPSPNEGIMAMAKQMAAERDRQLQYNSNNDGNGS